MTFNPGGSHNESHHSWHYPYLKLQTVTQLVHQKWTTGTVYGLVGAMLAAIIAAVTYECVHEYLRYLRHRALTRANGSRCCGTVVFTCWEKFVLSLVQMIRVTIGYFMMLCVMTMNLWLLVAVVVGAAIGYGVGKPLVANAIRDIVTSHGFEIARVEHSASNSKSNNVSQRSSSWRYQPINVNDQPEERLMEILANIEKRTNSDDKRQNNGTEANDNGVEIIWIRRSFAEMESQSQSLEVFSSEPDVTTVTAEAQLRRPPKPEPSTSKHANNSSPSLNLSSRFRSTSKTINDSFRSEGSDSLRNSSKGNDSLRSNPNIDDSFRSVTIRSDSYSIDYDSLDRRKRSKTKRKSSKSLDRSSSAPMSRFKSTSRQIARQQSFSTDSFEIG